MLARAAATVRAGILILQCILHKRMQDGGLNIDGQEHSLFIARSSGSTKNKKWRQERRRKFEKKSTCPIAEMTHCPNDVEIPNGL